MAARGDPLSAGRPAEVYLGLRAQALDLTAEQLDPSAAAAPVLALLMETAYAEAVATLVGLADGTTSMYFSSGGGVIGAGGHPQVAAATQRCLELTAASLGALTPAEGEIGLPTDGRTQFVAVAPATRLTAIAVEDELAAGEHPLSPLFDAAHEVIAAIRLVEAAEGGTG